MVGDRKDIQCVKTHSTNTQRFCPDYVEYEDPREPAVRDLPGKWWSNGSRNSKRLLNVNSDMLFDCLCGSLPGFVTA